MLEFILIFLFWTIVGFTCSMIGFVVTSILMYEDILNWYGRLLEKMPVWLGKPLGLCTLCFTGQLTLWSTFFIAFMTPINHHFLFFPYTICLAIFLVSKYQLR